MRKRSLGFRNQVSEFDRKRIQTVRLTLTIVICNFFLWAPFCISNVVQAFAPELLCKKFKINFLFKFLAPKFITLIMILGNLNSCVNPWIYIFFNRKMVFRALISVIPIGRCKFNNRQNIPLRRTAALFLFLKSIYKKF